MGAPRAPYMAKTDKERLATGFWNRIESNQATDCSKIMQRRRTCHIANSDQQLKNPVWWSCSASQVHEQRYYVARALSISSFQHLLRVDRPSFVIEIRVSGMMSAGIYCFQRNAMDSDIEDARATGLQSCLGAPADPLTK